MRALLIASLSSLFLLPLAAQAGTAILVNDSFDSVGASRGNDNNDPTDLAYYSYTNSSSLNVQNNGQNGYLRFSPSTGNERFGSAAFQKVTLGSVGESIKVSFDIATTPVGPGSFGTLNFGLYGFRGAAATDDSATSRDNSANSAGYMTHLFDDASNFYSSSMRADVTGDTMSNAEVGGYIGSKQFGDGLFHHVEFEIERGANGMILRFSFDNGTSVVHNFLGDSAFTFDNMQFSTGNAIQDIALDNLLITYTSAAVPEPASLAILAAGATLALRRKRCIR